MKKIALLACILFSLFVKIQAQSIVSIVPNAGYTGQQLDVIIRGLGTSFDQRSFDSHNSNRSWVDMGPNISIISVQVQNKENLVVSIKVTSDNSKLGHVDLNINTGSTKLTLTAAFEIFYSFSRLRGVLEVMPIQSINLNDFDPSNFTNSPSVFFATIYNDDKFRPLVNVEISMYTSKNELVGTMLRKEQNITENAIRRLTNKDFPSFNIGGNITTDLLNSIKSSGTFPPDNYSFKLKITDASGTTIANDEVLITITNPNYKPELISPGNAFNRPPEIVINGYPVFQWFGQADKFDFYLYKVLDGQSPEEAVRNIPEYKQFDVVGNILAYPVYAQQLIDGTTYAWQVISKVTTSKTIQRYPSDVFWFKHDAPESIGVVKVEEEKSMASVSIEPQDAVVDAGGTFQFTAIGYDAFHQPIDITDMDWSVSPIEGAVDSTGLFTAGLKPVTVAVIVKIGEQEDFATITIKPAAVKSDEILIDKTIKQLFGLPPENKGDKTK